MTRTVPFAEEITEAVEDTARRQEDEIIDRLLGATRGRGMSAADRAELVRETAGYRISAGAVRIRDWRSRQRGG